jgi:hypothetical protein
MHITFDSTSNSISLDNNTIKITNTDDLSFIPSDILQIYWYDTYGEVKYKDESMKIIDDLEIYDDIFSLYNKEKTNLEEKQRLEQMKVKQESEEQQKKLKDEFELNEIKTKERLESERNAEEERKRIEKERLESERNAEEERKKIEKEEFEKNRDYWQEFRKIRNYKLSESDWTQLPDVNLREEQQLYWQQYRQALRDLPEKVTDPKPLVLDLNHPDWIQTPS